MWCWSNLRLRCLPVCLTGIILSLFFAPILEGHGFCRPPRQEQKAPATPEKNKNESSGADKEGRKAEGKRRGSSPEPGIAEPIDERVAAAKQQKKELAMSLLEGVLASAHRITPVEYSLLTQVEAASLLSQFDKDRSLVVLKNAWDALRALMEDQRSNDDHPSRKLQRLRFAVLRKIARLDPDLLKQFTTSSTSTGSNSTGNSQPVTISGKWSDEARAIMSVAEEQIDSNPTLAAKLAQQSLSFGLVDWVPFLRRLSGWDSVKAEQLAAVLMNQFASSSVSPIELLHLDRFALGPDRSPQLREQFFRALAFRFTQDLRPDISNEALRIGLQTAQSALGMAAATRWQAKFQEIISQYELLLRSRSVIPSEAPRRVAVDTSMMRPASQGDTTEIEQSAQGVQRISDPNARDKEYQRLASAAASNEDMRLAEDLMSKIESDEIRQDTTLGVYGPLIRKELSEADWSKAQTDALKITSPLGRTLVLNIVAQMILRSGKGKEDVNQVYDTTLSKLRRDGSTENVAKGFLILAKSLATIDQDRSLEAINSAIFVLNNLAKGGELLADSEVGGALASWVSLPVRTIRYDEALDLTEMIGPVFKALAEHDAANAESVAAGLTHLGLSSLAQLSIAGELLKELRNSNSAAPETARNKTAPIKK